MRTPLRCLALLLVMMYPMAAGAQAVEPARNWEGAITAPFGEIRVEVDLAKDARGVQGGVEMPAVVTEKGADVTWEVKGTRASFVGKANAAGDEIAGTFTQGPASLPLTFRRASE